MFTVKVRTPEGHENLLEARRVEWINQPIKNGGKTDVAPGVLIHYERGGTTHYGVGQDYRIWVMNGDGNTVASYSLKE
jgi:hypothetical protein